MSAYAALLAELYRLEPRGIRLGLDRMERALEALGQPQRQLRFAHITGSNGKGSVAAMVESCARAAGLRTGLYTSPHLDRFTERIRIAGHPVSRAMLVAEYRALCEALGPLEALELSFFEVATLLAFACFRRAGCELIVLEVGLGGRLDATNVVQPEVALITRIALEHQDRLGDTHAAIAFEKAGIFKRGAAAISGARHEEAHRVIDARARELGASLQWIDRDFGGHWDARGKASLWSPNFALEGQSLGLQGAYQIDNAACALATLDALQERGYAFEEAAIRRGFARVSWPGRLEKLAGRPPLLLDAAHNPDAMSTLADHLARQTKRGRRVAIFGAMSDKEVRPMLESLASQVDEFVFLSLPMPRAMSLEELRALHPGAGARDAADALRLARAKAGPEGLVVGTGSIFVVAELRRALRPRRCDPPIRL